MNFDLFLKNLMRQAEENPVAAMGVGAVFLTAITRLISAGVEARNSRIWAQEVARRAMKDSIKLAK